jgi:phage protein U
MADSFVMMSLGDFRFSLDTAAYQSLDRSVSWRWQAIDRINARPAQQYIGPGEETISLDGTIYPSFRGGLGQIAAMQAEGDKGTPLLMVDGTGKVWGQYVITRLREGQSVFFSNGMPRKIDFTIELTYFGSEGA